MNPMATKANSSKIEGVRKAVERANSRAKGADPLMEGITLPLHDKMLKYNWVGFCLPEPGANPPGLLLGRFKDALTPHTRIDLNPGICGAAASTGKTVVVDDLTSNRRSLACSLETKSEFVVPIFVRGKVAGELDVDSRFRAALDAEDRGLIESCTQLVGR